MKKLFLALAMILLTGSVYQTANAHIPLAVKSTTEAELFGGAYLIFAGKFGGELSKKDIAGTKILSVEGCAKGSVIYEFELKITKNGKTSSYAGKSNKLSDEMLAQLTQLSVGDEFTFKNTKARLPKEGTVDVWAKVFTIV